MSALFSAALRATASLFTPGLFILLLATILTAIGGLALFVIAASGFALHFSPLIHNNFLSGLIAWGGSIGSAIIAWLLFPAIMPLVVSFFGTKIASVIEKQDYPNLLRAHTPAFWPEMFHDLGFSLKAVFLNIICLPLYLVPGVNIVLFYLLNGYLLGKEFFLMAARRYMPPKEAEALRRNYVWPVLAGGCLLTFCATVPFINLVAPFWGVALMTHLFHELYASQRALLPLITDGPGSTEPGPP